MPRLLVVGFCLALIIIIGLTYLVEYYYAFTSSFATSGIIPATILQGLATVGFARRARCADTSARGGGAGNSTHHGVTSDCPCRMDNNDDERGRRQICPGLYADLEELASLVDITYCVGTTGIEHPFICASRCHEFHTVELVTTWDTGILFSDSCGYIAVDHNPSKRRIIVAFRGTYSMANAIVDLSTLSQPYAPYHPPPKKLDVERWRTAAGEDQTSVPQNPHIHGNTHVQDPHQHATSNDGDCPGCKVHMGFLFSWVQTRRSIFPVLEELGTIFPEYHVTLVGHSLGGAIAALAALEIHNRLPELDMSVTTFGEPRVGNEEFVRYLDAQLIERAEREPHLAAHGSSETKTSTRSSDMPRYRRVTHKGDPVPSLPLDEQGYRSHAGEIYIRSTDLPPGIQTVHHCVGDADERCSAGAHTLFWALLLPLRGLGAHRDYFSRLGICLPAGLGGGKW